MDKFAFDILCVENVIRNPVSKKDILFTLIRIDLDKDTFRLW